MIEHVEAWKRHRFVNALDRRRDAEMAERQRFDHLVLGRPRPLPEAPAAPARKRKGKIKSVPRPVLPPIVLAPGVEEHVALRERWSHKAQGTPETHEHVDQAKRRPGSLARLYTSGAIDKDQLAAADQIAEAYRLITADVAVRTASLETRVDGGRHGKVEHDKLWLVATNLAYDSWRTMVGGCVEALLEVIVHDVGLTIVARNGGISMPRARRMLTDALDLWGKAQATTRPRARLLAI
jgi:hypothetical protein